MRADPTKLMAQLQRLVSAFPPSNSFPADEVLRRYIEALDDIGLYDIETAVGQYVRGTVPGQNPRFAPTPPELATVCRRAAEDRNRPVLAQRAAIAQIEARDTDIEKTDHSRVFVKGLVSKAVEVLDEAKAVKESESDAFVASLMARTNERFKPSMDPDDVRRRLGLGVKYTVGDPNGRDD